MNPTAKLRKDARSIFDSALKAADPVQAVLRHLRLEDDTLIAGRVRYPLKRFRRILALGAGKAGASMGQAVERVLGRSIECGLLNVKHGHVARLRRIELNECSHPVPDESGVRGAERIAAMAREADEKDLILCLISGGASALLPLPAAPVTLEEKQATTKLLLACGANIHEINVVRKHLSAIKGGQLARLAYPATVISLLLSDVIGDDLDVIGSGPTAPDASTFDRAAEIFRKYDLVERLPAAVTGRIERGRRGEVEETPKPGDPIFARTQNLVVGSNRLAVEAARERARALGYRPLVLSTFIEGETRDVARMHAAIAREIVNSGQPLKPPACLISGGETTVTLRGQGLGGRNQEFVLAAAMDLAGLPSSVVLSGGTDGTDGPTDAAGAIADGDSVSRAAALGMKAQEYLAANDSYRYFQPLGDLLMTGPTNTNVMDVRLLLVGRG
ncbi:MAG: glycerate kinase [Bryobacteraceae bacterium]